MIHFLAEMIREFVILTKYYIAPSQKTLTQRNITLSSSVKTPCIYVLVFFPTFFYVPSIHASDADMDGIPDSEEATTESMTDVDRRAVWWPVDIPGGEGGNAVITNSSRIASGFAATGGPGLNFSVSTAAFPLNDVDHDTFSASYTDGDYVETNFTTGDVASEIQALSFYGGHPLYRSYRMTVLLSDDNFTTYQTILDHAHHETDGISLSLTYGYQTTSFAFLNPNTS